MRVSVDDAGRARFSDEDEECVEEDSDVSIAVGAEKQEVKVIYCL